MSKDLEIIYTPQKVLRQVAAEVLLKEIGSSAIQRLIADMKTALKKTPDGVGLAAPQVGKSLQIFVASSEGEEIDRLRKRKKEGAKEEELQEADTQRKEQKEWHYYVYINPKIKSISKKKINNMEGCLSVPGKFGEMERHGKITVEAYDEHGKKFTRGASGFFARILQHELDHLAGTLFIDHAKNLFEAERVDRMEY